MLEVLEPRLLLSASATFATSALADYGPKPPAIMMPLTAGTGGTQASAPTQSVAVSNAAIVNGGRVEATASPLEVRPTPGGTPAVGSVNAGDTGTVVGGPQGAYYGGVYYTWYDVSWDVGISGWSVQDYLTPLSAVAPSISYVSPNSYPAFSGNQTMAINGSNFQSGTTLTFYDPQGSAYPSVTSKLTFESTSQLSYQFDDGNDPGTWSVFATNPGGQASNTVNFSVTPSVVAPTISSVAPNPPTGSYSAQPFTIDGSDFQSGCTVTLRDLTMGQTFIDRPISSQNSAQIVINPKFATAADKWSVEVINPGNASSGQFDFSVIAPTVTPTINSVSPNPPTGSYSAQPFTIDGSNFQSGCTVTLRDLTMGQTFIDRPISSQNSAQIVINPKFTTAADKWSVEVINPGNASSGQFDFSVIAPAITPTINSVSPNPVTGSNSYTLCGY